MTWDRPAPADVWRAIDAYLRAAYDGPPPAAVLERLARLRATPESTFYESDAFERREDRFALRLGNRFYPHMKLVVEAAPSGKSHFRVDTHDRHFLDLVGPADPALRGLMEHNEAIARTVEASWSAGGLRTVRDLWRDQLDGWRDARR